MTQSVNLPAAWSEDEVLDGLDIVDKSTLVGSPFRIIGATFQTNAQNIPIVYVDAENTDGYQFTFTDSSTGVRAQLVERLTANGLDTGIETGEYIEFRLVVPMGLRVSEYEVPVKNPNGQPIPGKTRMAKTYYLTTNGKRGAASKSNAKAAPAKPRTRAAN